MRTSECDIVIVGVGGQGVVLISDVIGRATVLAGKPVCGSETHGMAQRGGSVINHTRIGCNFSPMVASGGADVLVALEPAEALRFAHFLSPAGVVLVNTRPVLPSTVTCGQAEYPPSARDPRPPKSAMLQGGRHGCHGSGRKGGHSCGHERSNAGRPCRVYSPLRGDNYAGSFPCGAPKLLEANKKAFALGKAEVE